MPESKYPSKLLVWLQSKNGDINPNPDYDIVFYSEKEMNNFIDYMNRKNQDIRIEEHKPKLKELKRLNFFEKLSYTIPFKNQISDILVDVIKLILGFILGYFTKQLLQ